MRQGPPRNSRRGSPTPQPRPCFPGRVPSPVTGRDGLKFAGAPRNGRCDPWCPRRRLSPVGHTVPEPCPPHTPPPPPPLRGGCPRWVGTGRGVCGQVACGPVGKGRESPPGGGGPSGVLSPPGRLTSYPGQAAHPRTGLLGRYASDKQNGRNGRNFQGKTNFE